MIYLLIPACDDARRLERLLPALAAALPAERVRLVIVDDDSRDDTTQVVRGFAGSLDVWLVPHVRRRGRRAALRTALDLALEDAAAPSDVLVTVDPRDVDAASCVPELVARVRAGAKEAATRRRGEAVRFALVALAARLAPRSGLVAAAGHAFAASALRARRSRSTGSAGSPAPGGDVWGGGAERVGAPRLIAEEGSGRSRAGRTSDRVGERGLRR